MKYLLILLLSITSYLGYKVYRLEEKTLIITFSNKAMINCNRYAIRTLQPYGEYPGSYPKVESVMFPPECQLASTLNYFYAVKYNNFVPDFRYKMKDGSLSYPNVSIGNSFQTTRGIYVKEREKEYDRLIKKTYAQIKEILDDKDIDTIPY